MLRPRIRVPRKKLEEFCRRNHILKLSFFGSVLHDSFSPESDIDVLVEFDPEHVPGFALIRMQDELSTILGGRKIDLVTPKFLNRRIRPQVEAEAAVQYAQE
ncbi:MAG TPA: nucleotidyltransferase family protein [Anaerolineaceae bacterium]|nr:nucleotidyltransferase family protein [Anaerolineaceae bacterium]